ncbi:MAG TPA: T9SS type A sorting domain-containing protein [Bacteroidia bacterium]|nr:T9SS type A sorting domain-containing protein [Bacteroidia bacterium]
MKRTIYLIIALMFAFAISKAQTTQRCGTMEHHNWKMQNDPAYAQSFLQNEQVIQQWIANHPNYKISSTAPDTIPVVVHVVWKTAIQNISDAQVFSQIDVLNEDFSRTNADTVNTPGVWQPISGTMPYHFILARRDPNGNPTNGIVRVQTSVNSFGTNDAIKFDAQGGSDIWDETIYLNIWVGNLGGGLLGYGEFPTGTPSNTYGFVCLYSAFGRVGTVNPPYDLGRTTTHEISHCFNLFHIWGDDGGACTGNDQVADTPNQADATFGCLTFPATDACATTSPGYMFMNYMDYSDDNCMNMFTQGQTTRMVAAVTNFYPTIINSIGIQPVTLQANDAGIPVVIAPTGSSCNTTVSPSVTIKNWGSAALTSATINYRIDNNPVQTFAWSGTLASLATANVTLPNITTVVGSHTFTSFTTQPNGIPDPNNSNDTSSSSFSVLSSGQAVPFSESFTAVAFPPSGWSINNNDGGTTWARATVSNAGGAGSLWIDNYNYNAWGEIDEMVTPNFDLTSISNPQMTFYLAYRLYTDPGTNPNYSDTLEVLISTDCGVTYTSLYKKFGIPLTTTTPTWANNSFTPTAAQWRQETINLSAYSTATTAIFKIRNINQYENNLYVDDININTATSISEIKNNSAFSVYPNPAADIVSIQMNPASEKNFVINIFNTLGSKVFEKKITVNNNKHVELNLFELTTGVYSLNIKSDSENKTVKLLIKK